MIQIIQGDCRDVLKTLPSESVHCVVTSPPYWGLRDYGVEGQLGLEKTPEEYVAKMVAVFREVRRVLREDGTAWVNMGDSYASQGGPIKEGGGINDILGGKPEWQDYNRSRTAPLGLKPKDLCGIPWRLAFALQADGWWLRQWMPWVKRNAMPESAEDRPVVTCEFIFLLAKSEHYFYDSESVKLPASMELLKQIEEGYNGKATKDFAASKAQDASAVKRRIIAGHRDKQRGHSRRHDGFNDRWDEMDKEEQCTGWRSCRNSDWFFESIGGMILNHDLDPLAMLVNPAPYKEAHFATFPPDLVKPCILAGTSAKGCCPKCGAPWERVVEIHYDATDRTPAPNKGRIGAMGERAANLTRDGFVPNRDKNTTTTGWRPTCACAGKDDRPGLIFEQQHPEFIPVPCTVLDPFGGSGTTGQVALELGRKAILIELNPSYVKLAEKRTNVTPGLQLA